MTTRLKDRSPYTALRKLVASGRRVRVIVKYAFSNITSRVRFVDGVSCWYKETHGGDGDHITKDMCHWSCFASESNLANFPKARNPVVSSMDAYDHNNSLAIKLITSLSGKTVYWRAKP